MLAYLGAVAATVFLCWVWVGGYLADLVIWILSKLIPVGTDETVVAAVIGIAGAVGGIVVWAGSRAPALGGLVTGVGVYIAVRLPVKLRVRRLRADARSATVVDPRQPAVAPAPGGPVGPVVPASATDHIDAAQPVVLAALAPADRRCAHCGDDAERDDLFCGGCGRALVTAGIVAPLEATVIGVAAPPTADPVIGRTDVVLDPEVTLAAPVSPPAGPVVTRVEAPPRSSLVLRFDDGALVPLGEGIAVGRDPASPSSLPHARPVPLADPGRSLSKTHAALRVDPDGTVWMCDLHSANGSAVTVGATRTSCVPGEWALVPVGATVALGGRSAGLIAEVAR